MELDPKLVLLATAAIGPAKLCVDFLKGSLEMPRIAPPLFALSIALIFILLYQTYSGDYFTIPISKLWSGDLLAAFQTAVGAVLLTEVHKLVREPKKEQFSDGSTGAQSTPIG